MAVSLRARLMERLGRYIPLEYHPNVSEGLTFTDDTVTVRCFPHMNDENDIHGQAKAYMLHHFYPKAPVARSLFPDVLKQPEKVRSYLDKEMNLFLKSGSSIGMFNKTGPESQVVKGVGFAIIWKRNLDYDIIGSSAKDWHNAAAEIAKDLSSMQHPSLTYRIVHK